MADIAKYPMWVYKDGEIPRLIKNAGEHMPLRTKGWKESPKGMKNVKWAKGMKPPAPDEALVTELLSKLSPGDLAELKKALEI